MLAKQFKAVFKNSFTVCAGDSFFLVVNLTMVVLIILASSMPSIGVGEELRLIRDQAHSIIFIFASMAAALGIIRVVTDDIRRGSGSILMSRPINGWILLSGKLAGILSCVLLLFVTGSAAYVWITEINHSEEMNIGSLSVYIAAIVAALAAGAARQYMFGTNFSRYTSCALAFFMVAGVSFRYVSGDAGNFDLGGLSSLVLLFLATISFSGIVLVISVIADSAMVLTGAVLVFFTGLVSEYFFGSYVGGVLGETLASIFPNWQTFVILEQLGVGQTVELSYFFQCGAQSLLLTGFYLVLSVILFERIEIKGIA